MLLQFTLLLSFTGYLLPWDQLALWAVTVGTNMMGYTPVFGNEVRFVLLGQPGDRHRDAAAVVHAPCPAAAVRGHHLPGHPFLEGPKGWRHLRAALDRRRATHGRSPRTSAAEEHGAPQGARPARPGRRGRRDAADAEAADAPAAEAADDVAPAAEAEATLLPPKPAQRRGQRRSPRTCWPGPPPGGPPRVAVTLRRRRPPAEPLRPTRRRGPVRPPPPRRRPPPPLVPVGTRSDSSPSSRPGRSSRPGPRPRTRSTPGRTCWSVSSSPCSP